MVIIGQICNQNVPLIQLPRRIKGDAWAQMGSEFTTRYPLLLRCIKGEFWSLLQSKSAHNIPLLQRRIRGGFWSHL